MTDERWGQVSRLFHAARVLDPAARARLLTAECVGDESLRSEVESLLEQSGESWPAAAPGLHMPAAPEPDSMVGRQIANYRIQALLGAGGMGEVYRARDLKLGRDVAVKVLPRDVMAEPERLARFEREARILAALNHPNIATIHGIEEMDGARAIVMELIEGETLADRIARSPLPVGDALSIARQVVEALDTAHEKGIVHRDLKPANITISQSGVAKVLDFGLAKLGAEADLTTGAAIGSQAPTVTVSGTAGGRVLGTLPYMSPEQARGLAVDKRTDIWAFGCVLYEMLTARRAFGRATIGDTLAAILERDPDLDALPATTPARVRRLIRRCLERDGRMRLRDIGDARVELDTATEEDARSQPVSLVASRRSRAGTLVAALTGGAAAVVVFSLLTRPSPARSESAASMNAPVTFPLEAPNGTVMPTEQGGISAPALSPDGQAIANIHRGPDRVQRIWIQRFDGTPARELKETDGATYPFWSYDSRAIGFFAQSKLKRINAAGDGLQVLADTHEVSLGGTWNARDQIVYSDRYGLFEISAAPGGTPRQVAGLDASRQEDSLRFPYFLPDGRHFLFVARSGRPSKSSAYIGSLDGPPTRLFETHSAVLYSPPGYLLYLRGRTLVAQPFDAESMKLRSDAVDVADEVGGNSLSMTAAVSVSRNGYLAYSQFKNVTHKLQWVNRGGVPVETVAESRSITQFKVAPDGKRIVAAFQDFTAGTRSLWVFDLDRQWRRLTSAGTHDWEPVWSPDGMRVAFMSYRDGPARLYVKAVDGSGIEERFLGSAEQNDSGDWSPDGNWFSYRVVKDGTRSDVFMAPWFGDRKPVAVAATTAQEREGRFSPNSSWIAYESDENGPYDIHVTRVPPTGDKWPVSYGGGAAPTWSRDGRELFFVTPDGTLTAVSIDTRSGSPVIGPPTPLFHLRSDAPFIPVSTRYDVSGDGQRFLVSVPLAEPPPGRLQVVLNWTARLKK